MKKTILIVSCFLGINIIANSDAVDIYQDISKAIKKSNPELLKSYLAQIELTKEQIQDYILFKEDKKA